ncbi:mas-related G-protein coupled receptor member A6-like [Alosa alosa]|uniref:mas-related G-protein coupled receptor member A6-like n=1 Tax=Alosa alosa TaxID=278164 RepID=UPI0020153261|nr:mas-related G-protein coupled receptor member A6-like [Alosa alosa]
MANRTGFCPLTHTDLIYYSHIFGITVDWIIFIIGLPGIIAAIYALRHLARADHVTPVFVINLLISDFIQIVITAVFILSRFFDSSLPVFVILRCVSRLIVRLGISASLGFMVCISMERYLTVACPIWYRNRRSVKSSVIMVCGVWAACGLYALLDFTLVQDFNVSLKILTVILLTPALPLMVFCPLTYRALRHCRAIRQDERRRIIGTLALVLVLYMFLFLPFCTRNLYCLLAAISNHNTCQDDVSLMVTSAVLYLGPLADPFLYIFMRQDVRSTRGVSLCTGGLLRRVVCSGRARGSEEESRKTAESSVRPIQDMGNPLQDMG